MILFYELTQAGVSHAPFTRAFLETAALAFPEQQLTIFAQASHLEAALGQLDDVLARRLTRIAYLPPQLKARDFRRRFMSTFAMLHKTWLPLEKQAPQVVFLSSEPHHIWAAKCFKMLHPAFRCHMVLHGDLNSIQAPRARNPMLRGLDYTSAIGTLPLRDIRYITLETHIAVNLAQRIPPATPVIDMIRHPCIASDTPWLSSCLPTTSIRFGLLGIAGPSKGLDLFAKLALRVSRDQPFQPDFRLVGKLQQDANTLDLSGISGPLPFSQSWLTREIFETEICALHYVVLPYNMNYYGLSASGVLLDVLRWRKPVIALDTPVIRELANMFGDIGYICADEAEIQSTAERLLHQFDAQRYQQQRENLDRAYASRLPDATAPAYRAMQERCWS
ncbi:hypothetical protein [Massilia sp. S19_KUP03_FR1]|uniref:hypothetical protein n=1 Tax=Massilia sp. S19_KUP03_FR1 TaxID=3025503 RepID=UPI002FCDDF1E